MWWLLRKESLLNSEEVPVLLVDEIGVHGENYQLIPQLT
jgi:hypothetical protein